MNEECLHDWKFVEHCLTDTMGYRWDRCETCGVEKETRTGFHWWGEPSEYVHIVMHEKKNRPSLARES